MSSVEEEAVATVTRLAESCAEILQSSLVSAILHGSLTLDDFQPGTSDLDLLLVVEPGLTANEVSALIEVVGVEDVSPAGGFDLLVVTRESAAAPAEHPSRELLVGRYPGPVEDLEVELRDDDAPDVWPELSMARANGMALLGAEPREVLNEVPTTLVRAHGIGWLRRWLELADDDENATHMVLTACRIWRFAVQGKHSSKSSAARWALERDPSLTGVSKALSVRTTAKSVRISPDEVETVLLRVIRDVEEGTQA